MRIRIAKIKSLPLLIPHRYLGIKMNRNKYISLLGLLFFCAGLASAVHAQKPNDKMSVRIKDIAEIEGVRGNQLLGYGLVIGLNRTGDKVQQNLYARQTLQNLLQRMGISTSIDGMKPENIATVLVTATLPPFVRQGSKIDVLV